MKLHQLLLAGLFMATLTTLSQAQTVLRITGSTAASANVIIAVSNLAWDGGTYQAAFIGGTDLSADKIVLFKGSIGGVATTIKTSFNGSEAGMESVAGSIPLPALQNFLDDTTPTVTIAVGSHIGTGSDAPSSHQTDTAVPDVAMSDTFQSTSQFYNNSLTLNAPQAGSHSFAILNPATTNGVDTTGIVGVVPFKFCASRGATITGVTAQQIQAIFTSNRTSLSLLTGNPSDAGTKSNGKYLYGTGRNPDSGTRLTTFAETGLGALHAVTQYQPSSTSGGAQITTAGGSVGFNVPFPGGDVNYITVNSPNNGYSSGGKLAAAINNDTSTMVTAGGYTGGTYVAYIGTNDCDPQITGSPSTGIVELAYNGTLLGKPTGVAGDATYNDKQVLTTGKYTFWSYEHMYYRAATSGTAAGSLADVLAGTLYSTYAPVLLTNMTSSRATDGGTVKPN